MSNTAQNKQEDQEEAFVPRSNYVRSELETDSVWPIVEDRQHWSLHGAPEASLVPTGALRAHPPTSPVTLHFSAYEYGPPSQNNLISRPGCATH